MNTYKILLLLTVFCGFGSANGMFHAGAMWQEGKPVLKSAVNIDLLLVAANESYREELAKRGILDRACLYGAQYSKKTVIQKKEDGTFEFLSNESGKKIAVKVVAYALLEPSIHEKVSNSEAINNGLKDFSPQNQKRAKDAIAFLGTSALISSAEAAYDYQQNNKTLQQSATEYVVNTGNIALRYALYNGAIKPLMPNNLNPLGQAVVEGATGYATAYVIGECARFVSNRMNS